jgi:hypothetical protein
MSLSLVFAANRCRPVVCRSLSRVEDEDCDSIASPAHRKSNAACVLTKVSIRPGSLGTPPATNPAQLERALHVAETAAADARGLVPASFKKLQCPVS